MSMSTLLTSIHYLTSSNASVACEMVLLLHNIVMVPAINTENDKRWEGSQGIYSLIGLILHWNFDQQLTCVGGREVHNLLQDPTVRRNLVWMENQNCISISNVVNGFTFQNIVKLRI